MDSLQKGKEEQQEELLGQKIASYSATLYKIAFMQLKNAEDAEDVVQEVFCQYLKANMDFDSWEHEKAWFIKVTLNACKKVWRTAWNRHRADIPDWENLDLETDEEHPDSAYIRREEAEALWKAVWELPDKYREVIHLFYYENLSVKEIALVSGRGESTVTSQLVRGRNILKRKLREEYQFEEFQG